MQLTPRDVRLLRDLTLSHVLSRDQMIELGYFNSVTRVNTRLRALKNLGMVRQLETPFFTQSLYAVLPAAAEIVGSRLAPLASSRTGSPRFLQHALMTTNCRLVLLKQGAGSWLFEQQLTHAFKAQGKTYEVRPDGMVIEGASRIAVEVDLGHVAPSKFLEKLRAFEVFVTSGECERRWHTPSFTLLVLTTGKRRAATLSRLLATPSFTFVCRPFSELGIPSVGAWS